MVHAWFTGCVAPRRYTLALAVQRCLLLVGGLKIWEGSDAAWFGLGTSPNEQGACWRCAVAWAGVCTACPNHLPRCNHLAGGGGHWQQWLQQCVDAVFRVDLQQ
jgi:hypothetical protein